MSPHFLAQLAAFLYMTKTQEECIAFLEQIRWKGIPKCPYCGSTKSAPLRRERRHHCNDCFTSYSVTVGTLFHRTHIELTKWFRAIQLTTNQPEKLTVRFLATKLGVNKNTASFMLTRIRKATVEEPELLKQIDQAFGEIDY